MVIFGTPMFENDSVLLLLIALSKPKLLAVFNHVPSSAGIHIIHQLLQSENSQ